MLAFVKVDSEQLTQSTPYVSTPPSHTFNYFSPWNQNLTKPNNPKYQEFWNFTTIQILYQFLVFINDLWYYSAVGTNCKPALWQAEIALSYVCINERGAIITNYFRKLSVYFFIDTVLKRCFLFVFKCGLVF